ncbi:carboxypeptidase-like regulatory domain-containing protein [Granulicella arctica]|uniref:Carboxypeptidase regulatory-like domain-containing protein n=1 Tax=Granulicella arctica TaxID=940613 RepID=A0A7Y9PF07_9BACT|nr:carboxypeptidase-like regulatory domain-containing protein [Granulicella arctica]NYF78706.1 hypothetical protein [Granulicella arctica]
MKPPAIQHSAPDHLTESTLEKQDRSTPRRNLHTLALCILLGSLPAISIAQQQAALPEAPSPQASASIAGSVLDIHEGLVPDARITLVEEAHPGERTTVSDPAGNFIFSGLPPGRFRLTITAPGLETFVSAQITLRPGERRELPRIALPLAPANISVQVTVTQVEIAQEQVHIEEKQRVLGVFPNFYSSYIWSAAPLTSGQKFGLAAHSIADPVVFVATGVAAGVEQWRNTFPAYGQGAQGYGKRYGADYADEVSNRMFSSAIYPSLFHQDPRYFYMGSGSKRSRAIYAITRAFVTRGDDGSTQPNYSRILGGFTAGALSNAYHQGDDRGLGLTLRNGFIAIGGHAADNLLREFLFKKFTPEVPGYATGKP